jgi:hypothetical protein
MKALNKTTAIKKVPISSWLARFKDDYWFYGEDWLHGAILNFAAIPFNTLVRAPQRLVRLAQHFILGARDSAAWILSPKTNPLGTAGLWLLRLVTKTLDLFSFGEIVNALAMCVKINTRRLTPEEIHEVKKVFGGSIEYALVRVDEWSLIADFGLWVYNRRTGGGGESMAMTIFNTVHFSRVLAAEPGSRDMAWLIHELTHVAQFQHVGSQFIPEALIAQGQTGYNYGGPEALADKSFADFNREQQGDIVRHYYQTLIGKRQITEAQEKDYERLIAQMRAGKI